MNRLAPWAQDQQQANACSAMPLYPLLNGLQLVLLLERFENLVLI